MVPELKDDDPAIIYVSDAKEGLLGLIANQLCSDYHKPTIVFTEERDGELLKGSCRAPEGFNVVDAFNSCGEIMVSSGGHALAGGCSINKNDLEEFKKRFMSFAKDNPVKKVTHDNIEIGLTEIDEENYNIIQSFSPFGEGWKAPEFFLKHIKTDSLMYSKSGEHILSYIGQGVKLVGFGFARSEMQEYSYVDMIGRIKQSIYRGSKTIEFVIKQINESAK